MVKKKELPHHIIDAALDLAAERGWRGLSLAEVAARAQLPLGEVVDRFPSKSEILKGFIEGLDRAVLAADVDLAQPVRDRLFDVVMRRIEAMEPHKAGIRAILREGGGDPFTALSGARQFVKSVALMLEAAGVSSSGLIGLARVEGLAAIYVGVVRTWLRDDSPDLAKTMAALDRSLRRAESLVSTFSRTRPPAAEQHPDEGGHAAAP